MGDARQWTLNARGFNHQYIENPSLSSFTVWQRFTAASSQLDLTHGLESAALLASRIRSSVISAISPHAFLTGKNPPALVADRQNAPV